MNVEISYEDLTLRLHREDWENIVRETLKRAAEVHEIPAEAELSVLFCNNEYIHVLNKEYRGIDRPTDVLSFALNEGEEGAPEEESALGDLVISVDKVGEQAREFGHSEKRELAYLTVHGFLHIIGYDHEDEVDKAEMRQAEEEILGQLGITREDIHGE